MGDPSSLGNRFEPAIRGFFCQKCGNDCLSKSGELNGDFPASLKNVRIICAEKVGPDLIRQAFGSGADGVLICGCLVGLCRSMDNNAVVLAHIHQGTRVMKEMGIAPGRLRQEWICAPGVDSVLGIVREFTEQIRALGPLEISALGLLRENA
ncbi:MAG: hydrogenase iron-sulfur subunit [Candidatus Krumholzibacteria bacterium]|nr:hydrogenase iron-sulfur subunit [Candidatus Krumholzibacteria bacterium]